MINKYCMLVCDDPVDQVVFTKALNDVSPDTICFTVRNAIDAIYIMTREKILPSFVFIELNLPEMNGIDFLNTIKKVEFLKDIHVIVHTVSPQPHKILQIKESGALAIYLRPYDYYGVRNMLTLYFNPDTAVLKQN